MSNNKIAVTVQGGLGDNIIYAARLQSLLTKEGAKSADFYLRASNIWPNVLYMIVEYLESSPLIDNVYINRHPSSGYKNIIDWTADNAPVPYTIQHKYKHTFTDSNIKWAMDLLDGVRNPITFYPYTLGSNQHSQHEKYIRSPKEDWWLGLMESVKRAGGSPIVIGGEDERVNWGTSDVIEAYSDKDDFMNNLPLLYNVTGHVGIASWPWQITHYYGKVDTCVVWINNQFWIDRSISEDTSKLHIFQEVPEYEDIINKLSILKGGVS